MGSSLNDGDQLVGWKYYTPLKADYLNTILGETITPGLVTRPKFIMANPTAQYARYQVGPFSCFVVPTDDDGMVGAPNNGSSSNNQRNYSTRLVKITLSNASTMQQLTPDAVAIGVTFSLTDGTQTSRNWYASIDTVTKSEIANYKGIIIGTVQYYEKEISAGVWRYGWNVTTSGADISNVLLEKEGWNPQCWLSLISPRRATFNMDSSIPGGYNCLEVRKYNDVYDEYVAGNKGFKAFSEANTRYSLPTTAATGKDPDGIRGYMNKDFSIFTFNTQTNLSISNEMNTLSDNQFASDGGVRGGAIAYVDASANNITKDVPDNEGDPSDPPTYPLLAFANRIVIKPIHNEGQRISYFREDISNRANNTLYIK